MMTRLDASPHAVSEKTIFGDSWYADEMHEICDSLDKRLTNSPRILANAARKISVLRGVLLFAFSRNYRTVIIAPGTPGFFPFLFLEFLFAGKARRVIILEFIRWSAPNNPLKKLIYTSWLKFVFDPVVRRTIRYIHVLSENEHERYSQVYQVPKETFVFIPWPMRLSGADMLPERCHTTVMSDTVVASGSASSDWETLFEAAVGESWPLVVICSKRDLVRVNRLNGDKRATVMCAISREAHLQCIREAAVYVLSLHETYHSSGHVRLSECVRSGTPVIATDVTALRGYVIHNETGILIPPADPLAMRRAICTMLADREQGRNMAQRAFDVAEKSTRDIYLGRIKNLLLA